MTHISHPYFGSLNTDSIDDIDVIWEGQKEVNGVEIDLELWSEPGCELTEMLLDEAATSFADLDAIDTQTRRDLAAYHASNFIYYITSHRSAFPDRDFPVDPEMFVSLLSLLVASISIWREGKTEETVIRLDYAIAPKDSDEVLVVRRVLSRGDLVVSVEN